LLAGLRRTASRPVLNRSWDLMMYCCGAAALMTLLACWLHPPCTELAVFTWLMFFTSGPASTFLPSASEPILMAFGKLYPPTALAALGVGGIALVEWVNYRVFGAVMHTDPLARVRCARFTRRITAWFAAQPFATTAVAALTPIPFWIVRICGVLAKYPMRRFILATVIGRFPRIWLFAFLGTALPFSSSAILLGGGVAVLVAVVVAASRRRRSGLATAPRRDARSWRGGRPRE
jgi:membrane protein YqaA with SNARE-associated domain